MLLFCAASLCLWASAQARPGSGSGNEVPSGIQTAPLSPSGFEVKIVRGEVLVRRKGTQQWKGSLKFSEPIVVGFVDGDHKIYAATKALKPPKALHTEPPDYPPGERKPGNEGRVLLHFVVDDHGAVRFPTVDASLGPEFSKAAIEALKRWAYEPARLNGQPVAVLVNVTMEFRLY